MALRFAAQVFLAYFLLLVAGALWRLTPLERAAPDLVALFAVYLGLAARERLAPPMLSAILVGYLADLLGSTPTGLLATTAGFMCLVGHFVQGRLVVRGPLVTAAFSLVVGLVSGGLVLALRIWAGLEAGALGSEIATLLVSALFTGMAGPVVFRLCRVMDARFARTRRERDAALEGLIP